MRWQLVAWLQQPIARLADHHQELHDIVLVPGALRFLHAHDNFDMYFVSDAVHARHVWWKGFVQGLLYLQRGAGSSLLPLD